MYSSSDSDSSVEAIVLHLLLNKKRKRKSQWTRDIFLKRESLGEFHQLVPALWNDEGKFASYYRMSMSTYKYLVENVRPLIDVGNTNFRNSIGFEERLTVTLRFLATGDSYMSASYRFRMAHCTISIFIPSMCDAIYSALEKEFLPFPKKEDWTAIADKFASKKQFPNCVGALDGKHVRIRKPEHSGSLYYNYKLYTSIVFLALVSADLRFIIIDVGAYGRNSDGGVFSTSTFGKKVIHNDVNFPEDKPLCDGEQSMPHVIVADEAFRLLPNLMKPYPRRGLTADKRNFNFRLSHARSSVECAFGLLAAKFRVFHTPIAVKPATVDKIIKATCALHNMILDRDGDVCEDIMPVPGAFMNLDNEACSETNVNASRRSSRDIRDQFKDYFMKDYAV